MNEKDRLEYPSSTIDFDYLLDSDFPSLERSKSSIRGEGIFAGQLIPKGGIVCPLFGILYSFSEARINYPKHSFQITDEIAIETKNEPSFFNHSCDPNVFINNSWMFEALKDIQQLGEILIDYGTVDYFNYSFSCTCETAHCRKIVDGKVSAEPPYQKLMGEYFSPYLKNKFHSA